MNSNVFKDISYGMYIIGSRVDNKNVGCVINTLVQITSENPIIAISLNKDNYTSEAIKKTKKFSASIISEKTKPKVISKFGYYTSKETDKFKDTNYEIIDDIPVVTEDISSYIICDVIDIIDCKTHDIILGKVNITKKLTNNTPMTYKFYHEVIKGTSPKKAPTYIEVTENKNSVKHQCTICGYIYDDAKENIKFDDLPDDWKCPLCGVGKDKFIKIN